MTLCRADQSTLLIIDLQARLMPAIDDGEAVVRRCIQLASAARELRIPVVGTEENPDGLGPAQRIQNAGFAQVAFAESISAGQPTTAASLADLIIDTGVNPPGHRIQLLALDSPDRVLSLVLISTSPATPGDRGLPPPTEEFGRFVAGAEVDWSDPESVIRYLVGYSRVLAGGQRTFDEGAFRELARRCSSRAPRTAAVLEGGYNLETLPGLVSAALEGFSAA